MLNIYLGNFHPDLEDALCQHISEIKKTDKLAPVAIVTPSEHIRKRIKTLLTAERGMCLMGVHFLTFHALSLRLYEEKYGLTSHMICDDFFFTEMIRHILGSGTAETNLFSNFAGTPEGCMAIWRTIRELREARVEPENIIDGIRDGLFEPDDCEKLLALLAVYREVLQRKRDKDIIDYSDLPDIASDAVSSSTYLRNFNEIIYYGFYDLTQVQYDFLQAVVRQYPVTMFFPYSEGVPAASFTGKFYDAFIQGLMTDNSMVIRLPGIDMSADSNVLFPVKSPTAIIGASGMDDEISAVARAILRLVEVDGYTFSGIGVAARDINEYIGVIKRVFTEHNIPFVSTGSEPADRYPVVKAVQILISIHENGYRRSDVIDLVSSHCCQNRLKAFFPEGTELRPDSLDLLTRLTGITKGVEEWDRLDKYREEGFVIHPYNEDDNGGEVVVSKDEVAGLKAIVTSLNKDFTSLPAVSSWSDYVERFALLIAKYIDAGESDYYSAAGAVWESLQSLRRFERLLPEVALDEFIDTYNRSLEDSEFKVCSEDISGVQVLDAMSARAIPFKVLFIAGMNEKVFPRNIREDPLLRDPVRRVMERVLGYKIEEKLNGFEEEKLLFYLLVNSAKERLYITYQRTDDAGETRIPSWYISEVRPPEPAKEWRIPRRLSDKYSVTEFYDYYFLTPHELSIRLILEGIDASTVMSKFCFNPALYQRGREAVVKHEKMTAGLTSFDGLTGFVEGYWNDIVRRGTSPTSLEMFARCPFSYFARHLLGLKTIERPEAITGIQPIDAGNICHLILKRFYSGYRRVKESEVKVFLKDTALSVFTEFERNNPVGYPVIWEIEQERLLTLLMNFVEMDLNELSLSGFSPYIFETEMSGCLSASLLWDYNEDIPVHGIIDRVDRHREQNRFRIIDYKYKAGSAITPGEKDLSIAAIRGQKLQPPVYVLIASEYLRNKAGNKVGNKAGEKEGIENPVCDNVKFSYLAPNWTDVPEDERFSVFPGDCWKSGLGEHIVDAIKLLLNGIKDGLFFIIPGNYCKTCEYSTICRKNHFPSRSRAVKDDRIVKDYRDLRKKKVDS